jgi:predicted small secreted protein
MCKKRILLVLLLFGTIFVVTACDANIVRGSGDLITETKDVSNFDSIDLEGMGEVIITQGDGESLTIETDDNVMEHVKAEVSGGTLNIGFDEGLNLISPTRLIFTVGLNELSSLSISGSGDIESDRINTDSLELSIDGSGDVQIADLAADKLKASISGSGDIDLAGEATTQDVTIAGSGRYRAGDLLGESVTVKISGSGKATVWATESLDSTINGSGSVDYYGRPSVSTSGSGSGDINSRGEK